MRMIKQIQTYPSLVSGKPIETDDLLTVTHKYSGEPYAFFHQVSKQEVDQAIGEAKEAFEKTPFPIMKRYEVLLNAARLLQHRAEELAEVMVSEAGKTFQDALNEVYWTTDILVDSAEEVKRLTGEKFILPVPGLDDKVCYTMRDPVGVVAAITPYNFPLNLVAHKVGPALAAGNPVILKPASFTPVTAYKFCEILIEAGVPQGYLHLLVGPGSKVGEWLIEDPRIDYYSFTGSQEIGKQLKEKSGLRRVSLELGSNSATIVHQDYDPLKAAEACVTSAFSNAGQVCISLQRIYVHQLIYQEFLDALANQTEELKVGNASNNGNTDIGPMISEQEAQRVEAWTEEALSHGGHLIIGHQRIDNFYSPTILVDVDPSLSIVSKEVFGPVVTVYPYQTLNEAIEYVNDSEYGLQAGVLTHDMNVAMETTRRIRTGGVIVGGTCSFRIGNMPYGGVKNSGIGREGPRYAIEEMTDLKTVVLNV